MVYAERTTVAPQRTRQEIETLLLKRGAIRTAFINEPGGGSVVFEMKDRRLKFSVRFPDNPKNQMVMTTWRALLLCIKAKFASIDSKIETFDEAFLAHVVMSEAGDTVYDHMKHQMPVLTKGASGGALPPPSPR